MRVQESRISIRLVENPIYYPDIIWTIEVGELEMTSTEIIAELHRVATLDGQLEYPVSNSTKARESHLNWGASGSFGEYLIDLSVNAVGGAAAAPLARVIKSVFGGIRSRTRTPQPVRGPVNVDEARRLLCSHIAIHYGVSIEQLTETGHSHSLADGVHEFSFKSPDGTEYGGIIGSPEEPLECTRVWRKSDTRLMRPEYSRLERPSHREG